MKLKGIGLMTGAILLLAGSAQAANDDFVFQTRLDQNSVNWFIDKTRLIMTNANIPDLLTGSTEVTKTPQFGLSDLAGDSNYNKIRQKLLQYFKVEIKDAVLRVRITNVSYQVHHLGARPTGIQVKDPVLSLQATASIRGVDVGLTNGIQVDLMIPNAKTQVLESYLTAFIDPAEIIVPESLPAAEFGVSFDTIRDQEFQFKLTGYELGKLPIYVHDHLAEVITRSIKTKAQISADNIKVNPILVKLGSLSRSIQFDDFKPLIQKKVPQILDAVMNQVGQSLETELGPLILTEVFSKNTRSEFEYANESIFTRYQTAVFEQPTSNQVAFGVKGSLCTHKLYTEFQNACVEKSPVYEPVRALTDADKKASRDEITAKLDSRQADVALSVSEEYLNRLLKTTIDADLWAKMLEDDGLELGPKGAFLVMGEAGTKPELYLDLLYSEATGIQRIFVNERHPLHFPLRISTTLGFEVRDNIPYVIIKTDEIMSDQWEIINGIDEYGLESRLVWGFKRKIANMILNMASKLEGKTALEMDIPVIKGTGLEKTWYETSRFGRLNLYFKM